MKRVLALLVVLALLTGCMPASKDELSPFCVVTLHYPEGQELWEGSYEVYSRMMLRFADTHEVIPLSAYFEDTFYATVPRDSADRPLEALVVEAPVFTDNTDEAEPFEFYTMKRAVIEGLDFTDDNGAARPFDTLTRADAVELMLDFLSLDAGEKTNSGFFDVPKDATYAPAIAKAREIGLIKGDNWFYFKPERVITRQEFMVLCARALWYAELQQVPDENVSPDAIDAEEIAEWAEDAYTVLNSINLADWEETGAVGADGIPETVARLAPQKELLRHEAAQFMGYMRQNYQIYPSKAAKEYGFDQQMPIIDGSTSSYPFTEAVYAALFHNGYRHPDRPAKHSKSHASYERLIAGEADMLFAATEPSSDILELAKEKGVELELIPIAYDAMIFFTNANNPATGLTSEQISDIYVNNAHENWSTVGGPDALLYPYCRNNDSGSHAMMERYFLNGNEINETIRQETTSVSMANVLTDVMGAETENPVGYAMGYSIYYYFNNMDLFYNTKTELKLLEIDGVAPNDETIANGSYPLSSNSFIVIRKDTPADALSRKMAEFMLTERGQRCVEEAGFGKLRR